MQRSIRSVAHANFFPSQASMNHNGKLLVLMYLIVYLCVCSADPNPF